MLALIYHHHEGWLAFDERTNSQERKIKSNRKKQRASQ